MPVSRPLVIGHRGSPRSAAENTLASFRVAGDEGADWVETDLRCTADGVVVLHHDADLPDGRSLAMTPAAELPAEVPTLDALLELVAATGLGVNLELKSDRTGDDDEQVIALCDRVAEALAGSRRPNDLLVSSFDLRAIDRMRHLGEEGAGPVVDTAWLVVDRGRAPSAVVERARQHGHGALNPHDSMVDADLLAACRAAGLRVFTWTVNDPDRIQTLARLGVDGIITDRPAEARRILSG